MIGENQKRHVYYRCHTAKCPTSCIREELVEETIINGLSPFQFGEQERAYLREKIQHLKTNWEDEREHQIQTLGLQIKGLQDRMDRLTDAFIDRLIEKEIYESRKANLLMEKKSLEETIAELTNGIRSVPDQVAEFLELAGSAYVSYKSGLPEEKRELLKKITSNRFVDGKNVAIELNIPFQIVTELPKIPSSPLHRDIPRTALDRLIEKLALYFSKEIGSTQG